MKRPAFLCLFLLLILTSALHAEDVRLFIVYAEGKGFMLVRNGESQYVDFASRPPVGMELKTGDTVNLESRSTIELRLYPTTTVLKALSSTSFTVRAVYPNGNCDLDVAFGRVRTKTDDAIPSGEFSYNGIDLAAGAGGTDFGFDLVFGAGKELDLPVLATEQYPKGLGRTLPELRELLPEPPLDGNCCEANAESVNVQGAAACVIVNV